MKNLLIFLILILFFGCKDSQNKNQNIIKSENKIDTHNLVNIYPFNKAEKIEVISYPARHIWDKNFSFSGENIVKNGKLNLDSKYFKQRKTITNEQARFFFAPLIYIKCKKTEMAACYNPRDLFLFYDKNGKIFEFFEICFECLQAKSSEKFPKVNICAENILENENNLRKLGIDYISEEK
jgi:hypothetical protein